MAKKKQQSMITVDHLVVEYKMVNDRIKSIKEYLIAIAKRKIEHKKFCALRDISFSVAPGEVVGIIGHNGAGKSTLLKAVSGILRPTVGSVTVHGNIVPMLELGSGFDMDLNGRENIFLNGAILGYQEDYLLQKRDEIIAYSELGEFIEVPLRNYSSGMLMRLAFSIATVVNPEVLIVDEILSVGDIGFQGKSKARMTEMMHGGTTVLFVSHDSGQVKELCHRVIWLDQGKIKMIGDSRHVCSCYEKSFQEGDMQ